MYLWPALAALAVWLTGSVMSTYRFARKLRFSGPGQDSITPFIDAWTQMAQVWIAPALLAGTFVFVLQRWLEERRTARPPNAS